MGQPGLPWNRDARPVPRTPTYRHTAGVIHEVDSALRTLIEREAEGTRDVEIVFDAPTREWAGRRNSPTIDVYLYDIREDMRRRERGMHNVYEDGRVVSRHLPPRHFKLSYLITAWTQRPEDEHRLLSSLLSCFLRYEALPADVLTGPLTELGLPIPITIALPPPEDRAFADVWSALGGELKPSIDLVVITPLDTGQQFHTGRSVELPPRIGLGGSFGWPSHEVKSRNGVEVWPEGTDGPTPADAATAGSASGGSASGGPGDGGKGGRGGKQTTHAATGGRGGSAAGRSGSRSGTGDESEDSDGWETATGWARSMAPPGPEAVEPVPGRAAGRPAPVGGAASEDETASGGTAARRSGAAVPDPAEPAKGTAKGRPGPRVAMTRVRQTKKRP
jgi:hypothetical protein